MKTLPLRALVGTAAALMAWAITAPSAPQGVSQGWRSWELMFLSTLGALVGGAIGAVNGYLTGGKVHTLRGLILGFVFGVIGVTLGDRMGAALVAMTFGKRVFAAGGGLAVIPARILALTPIGAVLGAAIGASTLSPKRTVLGLIGGALGGAVGGGAFDVVGRLVVTARQPAEIGSTSRAIYAVALGLGIALFIGIVENLAKTAWLRQIGGRNNGKEWPIYGQRTTIGRSQVSNVPIFGDPTLQPFHATIRKEDDQYIIGEGGGGVSVDGQPVGEALLYSGASIQVGETVLQFLMKEDPVSARSPDEAPGGLRPHAQGPSSFSLLRKSAAAVSELAISDLFENADIAYVNGNKIDVARPLSAANGVLIGQGMFHFEFR